MSPGLSTMRRGLSLCLVPIALLFPATRAGSQTQLGAPAPPAVSASRQPDGVYTLPPAKLKQAIAYTRDRTLLHFAEDGWGIAEVLLYSLLAWLPECAISRSG